MSESYSVKATLSAVDKNFSSTMKSAMGYTNNLKSTLTSGIGFGAMMAIGTSAMNTITGGLMSLGKETIGTSDSVAKLKQALEFSGVSGVDADKLIGGLRTYADKTVFELNDVMSTFGALSANGIKDADKMTEAVGNAVAVFGGGAKEFSSVGLAFSQAMSAGALHAQDWNQVLNASPQLAGGLKRELIKLNPAIGKDFKGAMENGVISAELLGQAMNNIGMSDMAKSAATSVTTFEGAMGNFQATVTSGMLKIYDSFAKTDLIGVINGMSVKVGGAFEWLSQAIPKAITAITPYFNVLKNAFIEVKNAFAPAIQAIIDDFAKLNGSFGGAESVASFQGFVDGLVSGLKSLADFLTANSDKIAYGITQLPKLIIAIKGFKIAKAVAPALSTFGQAIVGLAGKGIASIAGKLFGIALGQKSVGTAAMGSSGAILANAAAFLALGAGVFLASAGFALIAQSAIQLAAAGPVAIAVMAGLVGAFALLAIGAAILGPALTAGAIGFLAFGAALLMAGIGFASVGVGISLIAGALPLIVQYAILAFPAFVALAAGLTVFAVGALVAGVALVVLGVGLLIVGVALLVVTVGMLVLAAATIVLGVGLLLVATAVVLVGAGLMLIGSVAMLAAAGLVTMTASMLLLGASALVLGAGLLVVGAGLLVLSAILLVATVVVLAFGVGMLVAVVGTLAMAVALKAVNSSMKSIASNAKSAKDSIKSMKSGISIVNEGLDALKSKAKNAISGLISVFNSGKTSVVSTAKNLANGAKNAIQIGLMPLPSIGLSAMSLFTAGLMAGGGMVRATASAIVSSIISTMSLAGVNMHAIGYYIGAGLAGGMASSLGEVRSVASQLANAAEEAVRAKAKIHSPSRVFAELGGYIGEGLRIGIESMQGKVQKASEQLIDIASPSVSSFDNFAFAYSNTSSSSFSGDYDYNAKIEVHTEVVSNLDGQKVGYGTAEYVEEANNKKAKRHQDVYGNS